MAFLILLTIIRGQMFKVKIPFQLFSDYLICHLTSNKMKSLEKNTQSLSMI